jgi:nucleoside-diphosphate-sugar epimerase
VRRVLVLGGDEFIGGQVLLALANSDWARPVTEAAHTPLARHSNIEGFAFDATDPASLSLALRGVDAVVNCLSGRAKAIEHVATILFPAAARCAAPPLIVHISSMSVYGFAIGDVPEDTPMQEGLGPYAQAKICAEKVSATYAQRVVLRPGCEYGPGSELWSRRVAKWLFAHRVGDLGAGGDGYCNLVHIDDLVNAVLLSLRLPGAEGQVFNLGMPDPPTWNEYFVRYAKSLGAVPVKRISSRNLALETKVLAVPLKVLEIGTQKAGFASFLPPPIPSSFLALARQEIRLDSTRARNALGWTCKALDDGLAETSAWFLQADAQRREHAT